MEIAQTTTAPGTANAMSGTASNPPPDRGLSSDFETFLKMLTTQMQNQNPLNPIESSDFAVQLATFSGVEQQVRTNELLTSLGQQMGVLGLSQLAGWVGMEARVAGPVQFEGSPITLVPDFPAGSVDNTLVVRDEAGAEVQRLPISPADGTIDWAGVGADGAPIPKGLYTFELESNSGQVLSVPRPVDAFARIVEARLLGGAPVVVLAGGQEVAASQISALRAPAS